MAPTEIFCWTKLNCENLWCAKVFGCPTYVLDPKLADNFKIPKWSACTHLGQFLGFLKLHSLSVMLCHHIILSMIKLFLQLVGELTTSQYNNWIQIIFIDEQDDVVDGSCQDNGQFHSC